MSALRAPMLPELAELDSVRRRGLVPADDVVVLLDGAHWPGGFRVRVPQQARPDLLDWRAVAGLWVRVHVGANVRFGRLQTLCTAIMQANPRALQVWFDTGAPVIFLRFGGVKRWKAAA